MQLLANKVVFLTGGSKGIGLECARKYAFEGAHVVVVSNDKESLEDCAATLGCNHLVLFADVCSAEDMHKAADVAMERFGQIDVIHNNAGIGHPSLPLHETSDREWQDVFDTNLKGILYSTRFCLDALKASRGCIINTGSIVGEIGQANHAAYAATKGAIIALTRSMALDYAKYGIRVNAVAPAGVWTPMLREWGMSQPNPQQITAYLDSIHLLGYCPESDVVADVCVFLASEQSRFMTGAVVPVSGGAELGYRR